jgi:hypothetical protein
MKIAAKERLQQLNTWVDHFDSARRKLKRSVKRQKKCVLEWEEASTLKHALKAYEKENDGLRKRIENMLL